MNHKEISILSTILENFNLGKPKTFIQHRNLNEFKHFKIERINPNHKIFLYGILKNNNKKKKTTKSLIKVGEILLMFGPFIGNLQILFENIDFVSLIISMFFLNCFLFYIFSNINVLGDLYYNRN